MTYHNVIPLYSKTLPSNRLKYATVHNNEKVASLIMIDDDPNSQSPGKFMVMRCSPFDGSAFGSLDDLTLLEAIKIMAEIKEHSNG